VTQKRTRPEDRALFTWGPSIYLFGVDAAAGGAVSAGLLVSVAAGLLLSGAALEPAVLLGADPPAFEPVVEAGGVAAVELGGVEAAPVVAGADVDVGP